MIKSFVLCGILSLIVNINLCAQSDVNQNNVKLKFALTFDESKSSEALDGRMLLMISADSTDEPRFQINDNENTQLIYGINVENIKPGEKAIIDASVFGYPLKSFGEIPAGFYWIQGLLNKYETFHLSDGRILSLPPDKGEGQQWNKKPGNLYSAPKKVFIDPLTDQTIIVSLDKEIPLMKKQIDTKYLKYVKIKSEMLSEWWGRPVYIGAKVLLPLGFEPRIRRSRSQISATRSRK